MGRRPARHLVPPVLLLLFWATTSGAAAGSIRIVESAPAPQPASGLPGSAFFPVPRREPAPMPVSGNLVGLRGRVFDFEQDGSVQAGAHQVPSSPARLIRLLRRRYHYKLFPFDNITQTEAVERCALSVPVFDAQELTPHAPHALSSGGTRSAASSGAPAGTALCPGPNSLTRPVWPLCCRSIWDRAEPPAAGRAAHLYTDGSSCSRDVHRETKVRADAERGTGPRASPLTPPPSRLRPRSPGRSSPQLLFECRADPEAEGIVAVAETAPCRYEMRVATPLACRALRPECGASCDALAVSWLQRSLADCAGEEGGAYQCAASALRVAGCDWLADPALCCGGRVEAELPALPGEPHPAPRPGVCCFGANGTAVAKGAGSALVLAVARAPTLDGLRGRGWCRSLGDFADSCRSPGSPSATVCTALGVPQALAAVGDLLA